MQTTRHLRAALTAVAIALVVTGTACGGGNDTASGAGGSGSGGEAGTSTEAGGDFCDQLEATWGKIPSSSTPEQIAAKYQELEGAAPDELKPDFEALVAQFKFAAENKSNFDGIEEFARLNQKGLEASKRIVSYLTTKC